MILLEVRFPKGKAVALHRRVTVISGVEPPALAALRRQLRGEDAGVEVFVDVDGRRERLTPKLATRLGLKEAADVAVITAAELPATAGGTSAGANGPAPGPAGGAPGGGSDAGDGETAPDPVAAAEERLAVAAQELAAAEQAARDASAAVDAARKGAAATEALDAARKRTAEARRSLAAARERKAGEHRDAAASQRAELERSRPELEEAHESLLGRIAELDPAREERVAKALEGLRRLRQVKPKPSAQAVELAGRWAAARQRLAELPAPPQPPEWLVAPALAALQEARDNLAAAEAGPGGDVDVKLVEVVERCHREVLEAEQRVMRKGSRLNRRRLEQAQDAERDALRAVGVESYGEYLQKVVPDSDATSREDRIAQARAALADAEAVWEELHGGQATPEWTAAREEQASVRSAAHELLGRELPDDELEEALRTHTETVVDTSWAVEELGEALRLAGVNDPGDDLEAAAERFLQDGPRRAEQREELASHLDVLEKRLVDLKSQLDTLGPADDGNKGPDDDQEVVALTAALQEAEAAERAAAEAAGGAGGAGQAAGGDTAELERAAAGTGAAVEAARARVAEVERGLAEARAESEARTKAAVEAETAARAEAEQQEAAAAPGAATSPSTVGVELWLLARVAALRAVGGGEAPVVVDGSLAASERLFSLLERVASSTQVVVVGGDGAWRDWAGRLGDRAAVRSAA